MLITNETPALTWTLSGLSGSTWISGAPLSRLTNGKPRVGVRFNRSSGSSGFELSAKWSTLSRPKIFALFGLSEEWEGETFGVSVSNFGGGGSSIDLGTVSVQRLPDGGLAAILLINSLSSDVDSVTITAGTLPGASYYIGEVVIATAQEWCIRRDWVEAVKDLTQFFKTTTGQPFNVRRNTERAASVTIAPQSWAKAYSASGVETLQKLQARLSGGRPVLVIPALRQPGLGASAPIDMDTVYATALFGYTSGLGQIGLVNDSNLAELKLQFAEAPAGVID